ncbi:flagellar biosynthetic protein FliO, partial [Rhizobium sp.]
MISMMDDFIGTYGNNLIVAVVGVGVALLVLAIALWLLRRRSGSAPFIRGGRNRQPRLQVLDATAVDARRRLVLVRRDNVEHLVMIGGPTDIVIESGIGAIPIVRDVQEPELKALPRQEN